MISHGSLNLALQVKVLFSTFAAVFVRNTTSFNVIEIAQSFSLLCKVAFFVKLNSILFLFATTNLQRNPSGKLLIVK